MVKATDTINLVKFGANLQSLRKKKGLSLRAMAKICSLDNSKLAKIEKGKIDITLKTILILAKGLDISPKEFLNFGLAEDMTSETKPTQKTKSRKANSLFKL